MKTTILVLNDIPTIALDRGIETFSRARVLTLSPSPSSKKGEGKSLKLEAKTCPSPAKGDGDGLSAIELVRLSFPDLFLLDKMVLDT